VPAARFDVRHTDTAAVESGVGTYGSRGTVTAGNAAALAAQKLVADARTRAAERWGVPPHAVSYADGVVSADGRRVTLAELAADRRLAAGASLEVPKGTSDGRAANPALVDAQLVGGVAFGIGNALHEALAYDPAGQLASGTLMDYALP